MFKVLVADKLSEEGLSVLRNAGFETDVRLKLPPAELEAAIGGYDALIVRSDSKATKAIIERGTKLKVIGRAGVGLDNVDLDQATRRGIIVMNTPDGNTIAAAEQTMALMLALARNVPQAYESMRKHKWDRAKYLGVELFGKKLGVIGLGRIGGEVAKRANSFGMELLGFDPYCRPERARELNVKLVAFDELLSSSDFITVHAPKTKETTSLIGEKELALVKKGVRLINVARGGIYDEAALAKALSDGRVAGVALDVFTKEPLEDWSLLSFDNVITTPHLGASTEEAQGNVAVHIAEQIVDVLLHNKVRNAANLPFIPPEVWKALEPYQLLARKMASFARQFFEGKIQSVDISFVGEIARQQTHILSADLLCALFEDEFEEKINLVNALVLVKEHGILLHESSSETSEDFKNLIRLKINSDLDLAGTLTSDGRPRLVQIDKHRIDIDPSGNLLIFFNRDVPGIIGRIGTLLGEAKVNIAGFTNGRILPGGDAVTVVQVDSSIPESVLGKIESLEEVHHARVIQF